MAAAHIIADVMLAIKQVMIGLCNSNSNVIPLVIIVDNASVSSRKGQANVTSNREEVVAFALLRSETNKCSPVAAIAKSIIAKAGSQSQTITSEEIPELEFSTKTNQDKYARGIGRSKDAPQTEFATLDMGPTIAFHHLPEPSSINLVARAGEEIQVMNEGARTNAASKLLLSELISNLPTKAYASNNATIAGVAFPMVSTGFLYSILNAHFIKSIVAS